MKHLRHRSCLIMLFANLWLTVCVVSTQVLTPSPTIIQPTRTPPGYKTEFVSSPTGRLTLQKECYSVGVDGFCNFVFENKTKTGPFSQIWWSSDDKFAYLCAMTHSSFQCSPKIWNMVDGDLVADDRQLTSMGVPVVQWHPSANVVAYYNLMTTASEVSLYNAESKEFSTLATCPPWVIDSVPADDPPGTMNWPKVCQRLAQPSSTPIP